MGNDKPALVALLDHWVEEQLFQAEERTMWWGPCTCRGMAKTLEPG